MFHSREQLRRRLLRAGAALGLIITLLAPPMAGATPRADEPPPSGTGTVLYLPMMMRPAPLAGRIGYNATDAGIERYPAITELGAGWYLNWRVTVNPPRPGGIEFVQTIRVHQELTCVPWSAYAWNRSACPYKQPHNYTVSPSLLSIRHAVRENPGSLWLIGNEIDRRDWAVPDRTNPVSTTGQDEILAETYARAYHDLYEYIKGIDPTARIGVAGVIQATDMRLQYLTWMWDGYRKQYGTSMPVDVWNVHNFILPEYRDGQGAGVPPGFEEDGVKLSSPLLHVDMTIFDKQIRNFRRWMKDHGQQDKPLIVSEYGVLYPEWYVPEFDANGVRDFMLRTFDYFLTTKDCSLGMPSDDCRLVQRWAWYSLDDDGEWTQSGFNANGALMNYNTRGLTVAGVGYRDWVAAHLGQLQLP